MTRKITFNFKISHKNKSREMNSPITEHFNDVCNTWDTPLFEELSVSKVGCDFWISTYSAYLPRRKINFQNDVF